MSSPPALQTHGGRRDVVRPIARQRFDRTQDNITVSDVHLRTSDGTTVECVVRAVAVGTRGECEQLRFGPDTREIWLHFGHVVDGTTRMTLGQHCVSLHALSRRVLPQIQSIGGRDQYTLAVTDERVHNAKDETSAVEFVLAFRVHLSRALFEQIQREPAPPAVVVPRFPVQPGVIVRDVVVLDGIRVPPRLFFTLPIDARKCAARVWPLLAHQIHTAQLLFPGLVLDQENLAWHSRLSASALHEPTARRAITRVAMLLGRAIATPFAFGTTYEPDTTFDGRATSECESMDGLTFTKTAGGAGTSVNDCEDVALATRHMLEYIQAAVRQTVREAGVRLDQPDWNANLAAVLTQTHSVPAALAPTVVAVATLALGYVPICTLVRTGTDRTTAGVHAMTFALPLRRAYTLLGVRCSEQTAKAMIDIDSVAPVLALEGTNGVCPVSCAWLRGTYDNSTELAAFGSWTARLAAHNQTEQTIAAKRRATLRRLSALTGGLADADVRVIQTDTILNMDFYQEVAQAWAVVEGGLVCDVVFPTPVTVRSIVDGQVPTAAERTLVEPDTDEGRFRCWLARRMCPNTAVAAPLHLGDRAVATSMLGRSAVPIMLVFPSGAVGDGEAQSQPDRIVQAMEDGGITHTEPVRLEFLRHGDITTTCTVMIVTQMPAVRHAGARAAAM